MLQKIRRNVRHPYIQALLGLVILVFIFFFGWSMRSGSPSYVAEVNGDTIDYRSYQEAYNGLLRLYQDAYKDQLTAERIREMGLGRRALDQLIDQMLLLQEAARRQLRVTDEELESAIQSVAAFQQTQGFSKELYLRVLDANRLTPLEYETSKRRELLLLKVEQAIKAEAFVSDQEVEDEFRDRNTKIDLEFVSFRRSDFELEVVVDDEALRDFYEASKESFRSPEMRFARYVLISPDDFADAVEATGEEIRDEYSWRADEFAVKEAVRARHILFRVPADAEDSVEAEAKQKAQQVREEVLAGADFAELAERYSDDPGSKDSGGDLGYFERGKMVPEFEQAAFDLDPGTVSEPVKTAFGYHLIFVEDHRQASQPSLEDVRDRIASDVKRRKGLEEAYSAADNLLMDIEDGETTWDELAEPYQAQTTPAVAKNGSLDGIAKPAEFVELLFSLPPDKPGVLFETQKGTYLVSVGELVPSVIPPLEEVKQEVEANYRKVESKRLAEDKAEEFLASARGDGWDEAVTGFGVTTQKTGAFAKKGGAIPKIGWAPELKEAVFSLSDVGDIAGQAYEVNDQYYCVQVAERTEADLADLEPEREKLRSQLLPVKQNEYFGDYLEELKTAAELEVNEELLL